MTLVQVRPETLYAWKGPSLLIVDRSGACGDDEPLAGYYFRETRFLSRLQFDVNGRRPWLCEAAAEQPSALSFTYTYPEVAEYGGGGTGQSGDETPVDEQGIPQRALAIRLAYSARWDGLDAALTITNHARQPITCEVGWTLDADFADIQEAQSGKRQQTGAVERTPRDLVLMLKYRHPRLGYVCTCAMTGEARWVFAGSRICASLTLTPHASIDLGLRIVPSGADGLPVDDDSGARHRALDDWRASFARMTAAGNPVAEDIVAANIRDVAAFPMLEGTPDEWMSLQAGVPAYPALFARDTLTAGWQAAWVDCAASLQASLIRLGRQQSDRYEEWTDEEPGRIPYQIRQGPLALLDINPYAAYYADYASPLMFVIALGHAYAWTGDLALVRRHWDTVRRILDWAATDGDRDGDGYLEYQTRSTKGTKNQGWKDSGDAIIYEDGSPIPPPLGTCELQGYWFAAQQLMAVMSGALGSAADARAHWRRAADLKTRFNRDWWIDDRSCIALAMDARKRPVPAVSSNLGHCIAAGIVSRDHLAAAVGRLFAPDMFSGWGIRTLSTDHAAYSPLSYHCGSVWAVEQATIAFGLRRFGFDARAAELTQAIFDLARLYPEYRIPECVGGFARGDTPTPAAYPRANAPQLWNASAFALFVHTMLGLQPVAPLETLIVSPDLPPWLPDVVLHDVRLAGARATLHFWRDAAGRSHAELVERHGTLRLVEQPPPESLSAGLADRLRGVLHTIVH